MKPTSTSWPRLLGLGMVIALSTEMAALAATIPVSGGGAALQTAISAAVAGDEIVVNDNLDYTPVTVGKRLYIYAAAGKTPRVV